MKNFKNVLIHLLVWGSYFNLIAWSLSSFLGWEESAIRALITVSTHAGLFYLNSNFLMPKFLEKRRVLAYCFLLVASLGLMAMIMIGPVKSILSDTDAKFHRKMRENIEERVIKERFKRPNERWINPRTMGTLISSIAILFVSSIYFNVKNKKSKDEELLQLTNQSLEAEKKFLKSQINPHFLFNTLNNLYSLATVKSDKTADAIQQLSEILRYSIYDSENKQVTLQKEREYIRHYIDLQALKDDGFDSKISLDDEGANGQLQILPMVLLPFIENAFKHGNLATSEDAFITIGISSKGRDIHFVCENSITKVSQAKDETEGIGLKNVKRRLELFYGNDFDLVIQKGSNTFLVDLSLKA